MEAATDTAQVAVFFNMGQVCCAGSRIYVQEGVYDRFVELAVEKARRRVVGDPFDEGTQQGSQVGGGVGGHPSGARRRAVG